MAFVRKSKFRHVFGQPAKKEGCYEGFRVTNCAFEGTFCAANGKWIAFCCEVGGAGAFNVISVDKKGRLDVDTPKISAHREYILDLQWNPFNDNMIATCSEDGSIRVWEIPDGGLHVSWDMDKSELALEYHERRCVQIQWHPIASNVLLSVSQEPKICIWNLDDGTAEVEIDSHPDFIWNASWSMKGDKIVTSCKDKKFRIFNARTGDLIVQGNGHEGSKAQRVIFTMNDKFFFSCGFSKMSERQYACWNASDISEQNLAELDTANGCLIPYYDPDTQMVYIAAKGDSVIRYYELVEEEPFFHYIATFQTNIAQRGIAPIPKRDVVVNDCEVMRFYKLHGSKTGVIEPISFLVPRKSDIFQDDLYPNALSGEAGQEASEWFEGKDVKPNRMDMSTKFIGKTKPKAAAGGGLKKSGLKGLKAKKDAKAAAKAENGHQPTEDDTNYIADVSQEAKPSAPMAKAAPSRAEPSVTPGFDMKIIDDLKNEIKSLKDKDKKREQDIKSLIERLQDYEKNIGDIKLLCDAVKKNDERIAALEALVQEESDEE